MIDRIFEDKFMIVIVSLTCVMLVIILSLYFWQKGKNENGEGDQGHTCSDEGQDDDNEGQDTPSDDSPKEDTDNSGEQLTDKQAGKSKKEPEEEQKKKEKREAKLAKKQRQKDFKNKEHKISFNPRKDKPIDSVYTILMLSDGHLVPCELGNTPYYRAWEYEGKLYYEFSCDPSKVAKAINNHSMIIDPYTVKSKDSVSVLQAKNIETIDFGILDSNFVVTTPSLIKYV